MQKKTLLIPLAAFAVLTLAACGPTGSSTASTSSSESSSTSSSSSVTPVKNANGIYNYSGTSYTEKGVMTGKLEEYAVKNHLAGIPLYDDAGYQEFSNRLTLPTKTYVTNYGFGTSQATINTSGTMYNGAIDEKNTAWQNYFHSSINSDSGTFNYWDSTGEDVSDRNSMVTSQYFSTKMNATKDGYVWYGSLATTSRPVAIDKIGGSAVTLADSTVLNKCWRVPVHVGAGYTYATDSAKYAAFNGQQVALDDYLTPFKAMIDNGLKRATDISGNDAGFAGVADYLQADPTTRKWSDLGIQLNASATEGPSIDFEFVTPKTSYYAMYDLSSTLFSPLPASFITAVGGASAFGVIGSGTDYTKTVDAILSIGAYVPTYWEKDKEIVYRKNADYFEANDYHFDGYTEVVFEGTGSDVTAYLAFLANQLDAVDIPSKYLDEHKTDANSLHTLGGTTIKMNVNSTTQDEWEYYFGTNGTMYPHVEDDYWDVQPLMSNDDFLDGVFFSIDRKTLADKVGHNPALGFLSDAYMIDPENGISYRSSAAGKAVLEPYTSVNQYGYSTSTASTLFKKAVASLEAQQVYTAGTKAEPTVITLQYKFRYQDTIDNVGALLKQYIEEVFNAANPGYKLVVNEKVAGSSYNDCYTAMDHGEYDFADGAITGNALNPLGFMSVVCTDALAQGFCLNWGAVTAKLDVTDPIVYDNLSWSFDGLYSAGVGSAIISDGVNVPAATAIAPSHDDAAGTVTMSFSHPTITDDDGKQLVTVDVYELDFFLASDSTFDNYAEYGLTAGSGLEDATITDIGGVVTATLPKAYVQALVSEVGVYIEDNVTYAQIAICFTYTIQGAVTDTNFYWNLSLADWGLTNYTYVPTSTSSANSALAGSTKTMMTQEAASVSVALA